ncbi:MAG: hypothetical protein QUS07_08965 [Methanothrix sp.]|nr:hypothetical protein [Methanothrix sp.]
MHGPRILRRGVPSAARLDTSGPGQPPGASAQSLLASHEWQVVKIAIPEPNKP